MTRSKEIWIQGVSVSEGIAIGIPFFLQPLTTTVPEFSITLKEVDEEILRYRSALFSSRQDLQLMRNHLVHEASEDAATVIETHIQMLDDPLMTEQMEDKIRQKLQKSESVFSSVMTDYEKKFSQKTNSFFQERLGDVMDLANRILEHLCPSKGHSLLNIPFNSIIFAEEIVPSYIASTQSSRAIGFASKRGGGNSHAALLARAKRIPYVTHVDIDVLEGIKARTVIVDGASGEVIFNPEPETLKEYKRKKTCLKASLQILQRELQYETETTDGCAIKVFANIGDITDLEGLHHFRPEGIGLFRTEYLFLKHRHVITSEQEQYEAYVKLIQAAAGMPIVIRVFDIGGDKNLEPETERNPVLGCRGIRFLLRHPDIFKTQLRAIVRAAVHGDVRVLLPLISDIGELQIAKKLLSEVCSELVLEKVPYKPNISLGCMVEVPSAVFICDALARESDFLSIGTNDLAQYTLGVDRSNPMMSDFYCPAHPSVLRMIKMVNAEGKRRGKPVTVCGEMASNPLFVRLLLGLGIDQISCSPASIANVVKTIRETSLLSAYKFAEKVLLLNSSVEVSKALLEGY